MLKYFSWYKQLMHRLDTLAAEVAQLNSINTNLQQHVKQNADRISAISNRILSEDQKIANRESSTEPWVELKTSEYDEVKGFCVELDWNGAFIQHLKEAGIKGETDEDAVRKWLGLLYADVIDDLEQKSINIRQTKPTNEEFI